MKLVHLLPPAAALLAFYPFSSQDKSPGGETALLQKEVRTLKLALDQAKQLPPPEADPITSNDPTKKSAEPGEPEAALTLNDLAELIKSSQSGGMVDFRSMMKLQTKLMKLSQQELTDLVQQTNASTLSENDKAGVQGMLVQLLAQKDPKAAVMALAGDGLKTGTNGMWQFNNAYQQWATKDPAAAAAWYDARIAAGDFENKALSGVNEARVQMESSLFNILLKDNPTAARSRLEALDPEERKAAITRSYALPGTPAAQEAFAGMVHDLIPEKEQPDVLSRMGASLARESDLKAVTSFLDRIHASPETRAATTLSAVQAKIPYGETITLENSAGWRQWVQETAPDEAPGILGKAMAGQKLSDSQLQDMPALLAQVSPPGKTDEVLAAFIESGGHRLQGEAWRMAESLQNPEIKAATLDRLKSMGVRNPAARQPAGTPNPAAPH